MMEGFGVHTFRLVNAAGAARFVKFQVFATNNGIEPCLDELEVWSAAAPGQPPRNVALAVALAVALVVVLALVGVSSLR